MVPITTPVPLPQDWSDIYWALERLWKDQNHPVIPGPPRPLILAGAAFSKASEIRQRWRDLVSWANEHGFSEELVSRLPPPPVLEALHPGSLHWIPSTDAVPRHISSSSPPEGAPDVADWIAGVSEDGQGWWPETGEQYEPAKEKPSRELVSSTFQRLIENWAKVVGPELAEATQPTRFTGRKRRRLVVSVHPEFTLPWKTWYSRAYPCGSRFTAFRRSINEFISPMKVDHIDFKTGRWPA